MNFLFIITDGTIVEINAYNLPYDLESDCSQFYGIHIHETGNCTLPFNKTGNHYNPQNKAHPFHVGDLPPLLGNCGYAYFVFYTERFKIKDIINRSFIIHSSPDDFKSQPSGNSGDKIGCGIVKEFN